MGDKIRAKEKAEQLGIPIVPGSRGAITDDAEAARVAAEIGYPVLVKAAAGGGGRGMKVAERASDLPWRSPRQDRKPARPSATTPSISRNISAARATSRCRCSATARARRYISASATARCSAGTRRSGRRRRRRR